MTTATVRITTSTREQLRELAEQTGKSMQALIGEAVAAYRRRLPGQKVRPSASQADRVAPRAGMDDELQDDPNPQAYKRLGRAFLEENEGKYAAFCDGTLVAVSADKATLFGRIREEYPAQPCLVVKVATQERVVRFRRPQRPGRTPDGIRMGCEEGEGQFRKAWRTLSLCDTGFP